LAFIRAEAGRNARSLDVLLHLAQQHGEPRPCFDVARLIQDRRLLGSFLIHFADHKGLGTPPLSRLSSRVAHAAVQRAIIAEAPGCLLPRMLPRAEEQQSPGPEQCRHRGQRRDEPLQWLTWAAGQGHPSFCPALGQSPWSHRPLGARLTTETWSNEHPGWHAPN